MSDENAPRDTHDEARSILMRFRFSLNPHDALRSSIRKKAAEALLADTLEAAKQCGYTLKDVKAHGAEVWCGNVVVWAVADESGVFAQGYDHLRRIPVGSPVFAKIEFEPLSETWIGQDEDDLHHPVPGARKVRRDPVAAIAEVITKVMHGKGATTEP